MPVSGFAIVHVKGRTQDRFSQVMISGVSSCLGDRPTITFFFMDQPHHTLQSYYISFSMKGRYAVRPTD